MLKPRFETKFSSLSVFGILVLDDPTFGGLGFPSARPRVMQQGTLWGTIPKLWHPRPFPKEKSWSQFPRYTQVRWWWQMRKQFQTKTVSKRFSNEVFGLLFSTQVGNVKSMTSSELCCHCKTSQHVVCGNVIDSWSHASLPLQYFTTWYFIKIWSRMTMLLRYP